MARCHSRVLSFPMVRDAPPKPPSAYHAEAESGFDALRRLNREISDPTVLVLRLHHEWLRVQRLAPFLDVNATLAIHGELELLVRTVDAIEAELKRRAERQAKAVGLIA